MLEVEREKTQLLTSGSWTPVGKTGEGRDNDKVAEDVLGERHPGCGASRERNSELLQTDEELALAGRANGGRPSSVCQGGRQERSVTGRERGSTTGMGTAERG